MLVLPEPFRGQLGGATAVVRVAAEASIPEVQTATAPPTVESTVEAGRGSEIIIPEVLSPPPVPVEAPSAPASPSSGRASQAPTATPEPVA